MNKYIVSLMIIISASALLFADQSNEKVKKYEDKLTIKVSAERPTLNFKVSYDDEELKFLPNTLVNASISASYAGFTLSFGNELSGSEKDSETYGKTEFMDYRLRYYKRKWGADLFFSQYKGFYLDNPTDYGNVKGDAFHKRGDLKLSFYGANGYYIFSDSYSFSSSFNFDEKQIKSGGSFLAMISVNQLNVDADRTLIPTAVNSRFDSGRGYKGGQYTILGLLPGAAYTLVINRFFITGVLFFGGGAVYKVQKTNDGDKTSTVPFGKTNARISVGYNDDLLFGGFMVHGDLTGFSSQKETDVKADYIQLNLYFGVRLF